MLAVKDLPDPTETPSPKEVREVLDEFQDVFIDDLPNCLFSLWDIQHSIDLVP